LPEVTAVERRRSPGWRACAYLAAVVVSAVGVSFVFGVILAVQSGGHVEQGEIPAGFLLATSAATGLLLLAVTQLFLHRVDHVGWELLFQRAGAWRDLVRGGLGGAVLLALLMVALTLVGDLQLEGWSLTALTQPWSLVGWGVAIGISVVLQSLAEEVVCRGYLLHQLDRWRGLTPALLLTALIFGAMHGLNPGVSSLAILNTGLIGIVIGLIRLRFSLWGAVGFHAAWNFLLAFVLGQSVSGLALPGLVAARIAGPALVTGGEFGPEASVILTALALLVGWWLWRRRGWGDAVRRWRERYDGASSAAPS
jgi:membrane protease YdiL (CAAX protease family)